MARKQPAEDKDVLKFKLDALQEYISFRERKLDQLQVDVEKAALPIPPHDLDGFFDRVLDAIREAPQAFPSGSAIEQDLAEARDRFNDTYLTAPVWSETKSALIEAGFDAEAIEKGFDSTLSHIVVFWCERMDRLRERVRSTEDRVGPEVLLGEMISAIGELFQSALEPAKHLRQYWLDLLGGRVSSAEQGAGRSKRRGREKDPKVVERNQAIFEDWQTGIYLSYAELAPKHRCSAEVVRKAVAAKRPRYGRTSSPARRPSSR
jgi:hypothetical protein